MRLLELAPYASGWSAENLKDPKSKLLHTPGVTTWQGPVRDAADMASRRR